MRFVASPVAHKGLVVAPSAKNRGVAGIQLAEAKGQINAGGMGESWSIITKTPDVPSPLVYDKLVYLCRESGVGICLDARTGEKYYEERVYVQTSCLPVAANGRIIYRKGWYFFTLKAGKTLKSLLRISWMISLRLHRHLQRTPLPTRLRISLLYR